MLKPQFLWSPSEEFIKKSNLAKYQNWLSETKGLSFIDYHELWKWSVNNVEEFWISITEYFDVKLYSSYDSVLNGVMPDCKWFEGSTLNYAEHVFKNKRSVHPAIIYKSEVEDVKEVSWQELEQKVASVQEFLIKNGVKKGDTVGAYMPAIPEATIAFLATVSIGAIWSSCSPDFGLSSVLDRLGQIKPKVLFVAKEYSYNGKKYVKLDTIDGLTKQLPTVVETVIVGDDCDYTNWKEISKSEAKLKFELVPFNHPIWVLYSSGTTGIPKAITHSQGGCLLEHLKYLTFHNNCKKGIGYFGTQLLVG